MNAILMRKLPDLCSRASHLLLSRSSHLWSPGTFHKLTLHTLETPKKIIYACVPMSSVLTQISEPIGARVQAGDNIYERCRVDSSQ
jgi:hypothetical protein